MSAAPDAASKPQPQPADREALEAEREFLLRSLDDLDAELLAGNIDPDTYRVLHDDYTARAAAVITSIEAGTARRGTGEARVTPMLRIVTVAGIVVFAALAAVLLAHALGPRSPGQTITGNAQSGGAPTTVSAETALADAKAAAAAAPGSYDAQIRYARALVAAGPHSYVTAVEQYGAAARLDPTQAEPLAYEGWLTVLVAEGVTQQPATRQQLLDAATRNLDRAIAIDPTYADSYVFKGLMLTQAENRQCAGAVAFQQFLVNAPTDHPMRQQVFAALADAVRLGHCPETNSTPTTKP